MKELKGKRINFSEADMRIIGNQEEGGVYVWGRASFFPHHFPLVNETSTTIHINAPFADYCIRSHSDNVITIYLLNDVLSAALPSAEHTCTNEVVMKLANKNNVPMLSFEISCTTHMGRRVNLAA
jgi:hypothetical protein